MHTITGRDGVTLAYDIQGRGAPVVLVDGAFCDRSFGPTPKLAPLLVDDATVLRYDRRGRGESGDHDEYRVEKEIDDLAAVIESAGGTADVVAFSSGAILALRAAAAGVPIRRLVAWEPPLVDEADGGHRPPADAEAQLRRLVAAGGPDRAVKYFLTQVMGAPALMYGFMRVAPFWSHMRRVAPSLANDAAVLLDGLDGAERWLARVTAPTLVLSGAKSARALRSAAVRTARSMPDATHRELPKVSHNVRAEVLAPAVVEFLRPGGVGVARDESAA